MVVEALQAPPLLWTGFHSSQDSSLLSVQTNNPLPGSFPSPLLIHASWSDANEVSVSLVSFPCSHVKNPDLTISYSCLKSPSGAGEVGHKKVSSGLE